MATPQGNFIAYQPLKPEEYKVGDLYSNYVMDLIKRGDIKRAADAKMKEQQMKAIGERFDKMDVKPYATDSTMTDMAMNMFKDTSDYIGEMRLRAERDPSKAFQYSSLADKAKNDYLALAESFKSPDFLKKLDDKRVSIASGEVFDDSDELDKFKLISNGMINPVFDKANGTWKFMVPKNNNSTSDEVPEFLSAGELIGVFTNPTELDLLNDTKSNGGKGFYNQIRDDAKLLGDEFTKNTDGNITKSWAGYATERGRSLFDTTYGDYSSGPIDPRLDQYSKVVLGKKIESEEEFNKVRSSVLDRYKSYVPNDTGIKTEDSGIDIALKNERLKGERLSNKQKAYDLANPNKGGSSSNDNPLGNGSLSDTPVVLNIKQNNGNIEHFNTRGINYFVNGNTNSGRQTKIGVTTYWNPNANGPNKGGYSYAMNIPSNNGKDIVVEGISSARATNILSSNKVKDPENVLAYMKTIADQKGLNGKKPKIFGKNYQNYKVNFSASKKTDSDL